jgi:hypothetical protein
MVIFNGEIKKLMDEHEGIREHMKFLVKSRGNLMIQDIHLKERIRNYCCILYDFRDAVRYHLELDEFILKSLSGNVSLKDLTEQHEEIRRVINDLIAFTESGVIDGLVQENVNQFNFKIGTAVNKICSLIETHIAQENTILEGGLKHI